MLCAPVAHADDEPGGRRVPPSTYVEVPDLGGATLAQADVALRHRGLLRGEVFEISKERMYAYILKHWPTIRDPAGYVKRFKRGYVFSQRPSKGNRMRRGAKVDIVIIARNDGKVPPVAAFTELEVLALPADARNEDDIVEPARRREEPKDAPAPAAPTLPSTDTPGPQPTELRDPLQPRAPAPPPADDPAPAVDRPTKPAPGATEIRPTADRTPSPNAAVAVGSPEAPRSMKELDPNKVPRFIGMDLVDAETVARQLGLTIYTERVAGHPVGRILEQVPEPGTRKPQGNVVKVVVTAGGDHEARTPAAPEVYVGHVQVPDLLDRTKLQARRILEAMGLKVDEETAKAGMPGRVVDTRPPLGTKVPKGSIVVIRLGPGELPKGPTGPYRGPTSNPSDPSAGSNVPVVQGSGTVPRTIAPTASTRLPTDATIPMGFSWSKVARATAYLLEVEEQTAAGGWIANARKPVRTTAATLEMERLDTSVPRAFRWRVRAVFTDRQGEASPWVVLK